MNIAIPERLRRTVLTLDDRGDWLTRLPSVVERACARWSLELENEQLGEVGSCSWVSAARLPEGTPAILKVTVPHMEADDEIAGLRLWAGGPMVRLIAADEADGAMLIERCRPGSVLRERPEDEQDEVIAELARELWRPAQPGWPFRPLSDMLEYWSASTLESRDSWRHPALVERGLELFSELVGSARQRVLHTDLHAGNVLRAERRPWLAIDPKPFVGDPAYDATQHLFNCRDRLGRRPDRTIERVARLLGLDAARVRRWTFARATAEPQGDWNDAWRLALAYSLADEVR